MTSLHAFSMRQTGFTAALNNSAEPDLRSWRPEAKADDVPRCDKNGDNAASQGNEQGVDARTVVYFCFRNANGKEKTVEREQWKERD